MLIFLLQIGVLLAVATGLGRAAARLNFPRVVGELAAGVIMGPSLLGNLSPGLSNWLLPQDAGQMNLLNAVAQVGVLLLVAVTGAHVDLTLLRRKRRVIAWVSAGSVLIPLVLGFVLGLVLPAFLIGPSGRRATFALLVGVAVAVSALPVIAKTLLDMGLLHRDVGQVIVGSAAVSDIVGWLLLSVVSAMATLGLRTEVVLKSIGCLLLVLTATVFLARPLARRLLRPAGRPADRDLSVSIIVVLVLLSAAATHALGMEPILGAFLCGIVVGSLSADSRRCLDSMRGFVMAVLAPLFLATAGLQVDLAALGHVRVLAAALATLAVAVGTKFAGAYLGARAGRLNHTEAFAIGAGLNARGLVEIVLASVGRQLGVLTSASYTIIVLVAVLTSVMAPSLLRRTTGRIPTTPAETERQREFTSQPA